VPPPNRHGSPTLTGKICRNYFEDEFVPVFEVVDDIYKLRIMLDINGCNLEFGFVMYSTTKIAYLAVRGTDYSCFVFVSSS
jgi:hypothetical protein